MVKHEIGDLFASGAEITAHGCNCRGGYGSGVAATIAKLYPSARRAYFKKYDGEGWKLGDVQFIEIETGKFIANCATQDQYYPRNIVHADYDAIREAMTKVKKFAALNNISIAIPRIGAGLAGGDWSIIEGILNEVFTDYDVTVFSLK